MKLVVIIPFLLITKCVLAQDWSSYESTDFYIEYPTEWKVDESGNHNTKFMLFSPRNNEQDAFLENVNLIVQDLSAYNFDLESFTELSLDQLKEIFADARIISTESKHGTNGPYRTIVYAATQNGNALQWKQFYWVQNNEAFILTFTAEEAQFEKYLETANKILSSFRIK